MQTNRDLALEEDSMNIALILAGGSGTRVGGRFQSSIGELEEGQ